MWLGWCASVSGFGPVPQLWVLWGWMAMDGLLQGFLVRVYHMSSMSCFFDLPATQRFQPLRQPERSFLDLENATPEPPFHESWSIAVQPLPPRPRLPRP